MSILSTITSVVSKALGVPRLLTTGVKRTVARMLSYGLDAMGLDTVGIEKQIADVFKSPVTRDISDTVRDITTRSGLVERVGSLAGDVRFARNMMFETKFTNDRKYRFIGLVNVRNVDTGQFSSRWISFYTDDNLTKEELGQWYEDNVMNRDYEETVALEGFNFYEVWHNKGRLY